MAEKQKRQQFITLTDMGDGDKEIKTLFENFEKQWYNTYKSVSVPSQETFSKIYEGVVKQAINSVWCADGKHFSDNIKQIIKGVIRYGR